MKSRTRSCTLEILIESSRGASAAKAAVVSPRFPARLKPCPFKTAPDFKTALIQSVHILVCLLTALSIPICAAAQSNPKHHTYKLIDLGTLGGPHDYGSPNGDGSKLLNEPGVVAASADTEQQDPFAPNFCFEADCLVAHVATWKNGHITDLVGINKDYSSSAGSINAQGWSTGRAETGEFDPQFGLGYQLRAFLSKGENTLNLGTLPGGSESFGVTVNDSGQVIGLSDNGIPDPFPLFPLPTEIHTFLWQNGVMQDIGTLGGPDTFPGVGCDNQRRSYIVGSSYTSFTPNQSTGIPTFDAFLWENGRMTDLGNLGGTMSFGQCANNHGQIIGTSTLLGDVLTHAFLYERGTIKDLGTLGGPNSEAIWINDAGEIAGSADLPGINLHDAVLWRHGKILDLGTVDGDACSRGRGINSRGQVVGGSSDCSNFLHAFVWEEGGPMLDLNTLIPPGSGLQLTNAININDRGEILAKSIPQGVTPIDDEDLGHLVLLVPCGEHEGEDCRNTIQPSNGTASPATAKVSAPQRPQTDRDLSLSWRSRFSGRSPR